MSQPRQEPESRPLVSGTSILIFSGFLIGVTVGRGVGGELSPYVLSCGLAGMLAFVGFELVQARKREWGLLRERKIMLTRLERYLDDSHPADEFDAMVAKVKPRQSSSQAVVPQLAE
jgi:hypothetical protein